MPLSWVKTKFADFGSQVLGELATELEAEVSEDLVEALAAAASLVAFADGVSSPEEREELLAVFEEEDRLTELDLDDLFDAFDDYAERFAEDAKAAESRSAGGGRPSSTTRPSSAGWSSASGPGGGEQRRGAVAGGGEGRDAAVRGAWARARRSQASRSSGAEDED